MIKCIRNNFGAGEITFRDYQSKSLSVLDGTFCIDPTNEEYQAASRLEVELPSSFLMRKSAISNAYIVSSQPELNSGTVLKAWIENKTLCIEKLTCWDEYGTLTIIVASAFVTRGYRGELTEAQCVKIGKGAIIQGDNNYNACMIKDEYIYLTCLFSKFPYAFNGLGPFSAELLGIPKDIDVCVPICAQGGYSQKGQIGGTILAARLQNGHLHFRFPLGASNMGGKETFTAFFVLRGGYVPEVVEVAPFVLQLSNVVENEVTTVREFSFKTSSAVKALCIDANVRTSEEDSPFVVEFNESPSSAPYTMKSFFLGRSMINEDYVVSYHEFAWSKYHKATTYNRCSKIPRDDMQIFGTSLIAAITE